MERRALPSRETTRSRESIGHAWLRWSLSSPFAFANTMMVVDPDLNDDGNPVDAKTLGRIVLTSADDTKQDDQPIEHLGMGGQGVLPVPLVYNGWVQNVLNKGSFRQLTCEQRHLIGSGGC